MRNIDSFNFYIGLFVKLDLNQVSLCKILLWDTSYESFRRQKLSTNNWVLFRTTITSS